MEVANWLYSLDDVNIHARNDTAFNISCYKNRIEVAKWLYSLGGIVLAALMLVVAMFYAKILNNHYFFRISLFVELVLLVMVVYFLLYSYNKHFLH